MIIGKKFCWVRKRLQASITYISINRIQQRSVPEVKPIPADKILERHQIKEPDLFRVLEVQAQSITDIEALGPSRGRNMNHLLYSQINYL